MPTSQPTDKLLTKDQLAEMLGLKRRGVETLVARRVLPVIRLSSRVVRFRLSEVQAAIARHEVKALR